MEGEHKRSHIYSLGPAADTIGDVRTGCCLALPTTLLRSPADSADRRLCTWTSRNKCKLNTGRTRSPQPLIKTEIVTARHPWDELLDAAGLLSDGYRPVCYSNWRTLTVLYGERCPHYNF